MLNLDFLNELRLNVRTKETYMCFKQVIRIIYMFNHKKVTILSFYCIYTNHIT